MDETHLVKRRLEAQRVVDFVHELDLVVVGPVEVDQLLLLLPFFTLTDGVFGAGVLVTCTVADVRHEDEPEPHGQGAEEHNRLDHLVLCTLTAASN